MRHWTCFFWRKMTIRIQSSSTWWLAVWSLCFPSRSSFYSFSLISSSSSIKRSKKQPLISRIALLQRAYFRNTCSQLCKIKEALALILHILLLLEETWLHKEKKQTPWVMYQSLKKYSCWIKTHLSNRIVLTNSKSLLL